MEKFILCGLDKEKSKMRLKLPLSKHFVLNAVKNGEKVLKIQELVTKAVERKDPELDHIKPYLGYGTERQDVPKTLQHILSHHPYPLSQGTLSLLLGSLASDSKSLHEVVIQKTVFSHVEEDQKCLEWIPKDSGIPCWASHSETYNVGEVKFNIQGAASTMGMEIVYTCNLFNCVIFCGCRICSDRVFCSKLVHTKGETCRRCSRQCTLHAIKMPRLFKVESEMFTMVTDKVDEYLFAIPYAGIPNSCNECKQDVLEHQVFHLVPHLQCKFCKQETRPFSKMVQSMPDYKKSLQLVNSADEKTCGICLSKFRSPYERKKHEVSIHHNKERNHECEVCGKTYSNENALKYHNRSKHEVSATKIPCYVCGKQFSSERTMQRHNKIVHVKSPGSQDFVCIICGSKFNRKDALDRHDKEQHYGSKVNFAYVEHVEDMEALSSVNCELCVKRFKRNSDLKRHILSIHSETPKEVTCKVCGKTFSRNFTLNRHMKSTHTEQLS